eukprot:scaffold83329_cov23-Cyclotella_meneghiniana.AAC.1
MERARPSTRGCGSLSVAKRGLRPWVPPKISPYKITSDFTGFNTGSMGFHGFQRGAEVHNTVKARRIRRVPRRWYKGARAPAP